MDHRYNEIRTRLNNAINELVDVLTMVDQLVSDTQQADHDARYLTPTKEH